MRGIIFLFFYNFLNSFVDSFNISQYISITKSYYFYAELIQFFGSGFISLPTLIFIVSSTVSFNAKSVFRRIKI